MGLGGRKGGRDFSLEGRHLVGLFLLLVVIFGMVFTLGYMLGRSQGDSQSRAAADASDIDLPVARKLPGKQQAAQATAPQSDPSADAPAASVWDFFHSGDPAADHPADASSADEPGASVDSKVAGANGQPAGKGARAQNGQLIPKGAIMLQVAALKSEADALALAQALQQKKLPAFVIPPGADNYYRVQVGPYKTPQAAAAGRDVLEAQGFKSITKR